MADVTPARKKGFSNDTNHVLLVGGIVRVFECFKNDAFSARKITLVTNANKRNSDGTFDLIPTYHTVKMYGKLAEIFSANPGEKYMVIGKLHTYHQKKPDGTYNNNVEVVVDRIHKLGNMSKRDISTHDENLAELPQKAPSSEQYVDEITIEDLPF
jgi:single-stranded DNA-binding protein